MTHKNDKMNFSKKDMTFKMLFGKKNQYLQVFPSINDIFKGLVEATIYEL